MRKLLLALVLLFGWASSADAAIYWVRPTGILGGCVGSATAPASDAGYMSTIAAAINCATLPGDQVQIRAGTYDERLINSTVTWHNGTSGNPIIISGYSSETVIVQPSSGAEMMGMNTAQSWITIKDIIFDGNNRAEADGIGVCCYGSDDPPRPSNIVFDGVTVRHVPNGGGVSIFTSDITFKNGEVWDTAFCTGGCPTGQPHGFYITGQRIKIINNYIHDNGGYGVHMFRGGATAYGFSSVNDDSDIYNNIIANNGKGNSLGGAGGFGIVVEGNWTGDNPQLGFRIYNNIVYGNGKVQGFGGGIQTLAAVNAKIYNNTVYDHPSEGIVVGRSDWPNHIIKNNISVGNAGANISPETATVSNNLTGTLAASSVRFVDPPNGDLRPCLAAGNPHPNCTGVSAAIDQGAPLGAPYNVDIAGTSRPVGASYDIGAYEAGVTSPVEPDPAYVARYSFDSVATDSSGNTNTGTLTNGAAYTSSGKYNGSLLLDGVDDYVNVNDSSSLDLTHGFMISAWVYPTSTMTGFIAIVVKDGGDGTTPYYLYASSSGYCGDGAVLAGYQTADGSVATACYATPLTLNAWNYVRADYNRTTVTLYVNSPNAVTTGSGSAFIPATTGALTIGASPFGEYFPGRIDEVQIANNGSVDTVATMMATPLNAIGAGTAGMVIGPSGLTLGAGASPLKLGGAP